MPSEHQILGKFTGRELIATKNWDLYALLTTVFKDTEFASSYCGAKGNASVSIRNYYAKRLGIITKNILVLLISFSDMRYASFFIIFKVPFQPKPFHYFFLLEISLMSGSDLFSQWVKAFRYYIFKVKTGKREEILVEKKVQNVVYYFPPKASCATLIFVMFSRDVSRY